MFVGLCQVEEGQGAGLRGVKQLAHLHMILLLSHVAIRVREVLGGIVRQVINMVQCAAPNGHDVCAVLRQLGLDLGLNFNLFIRRLSLVYNSRLKIWGDEPLKEIFGFLVGDQKAATQRSQTRPELRH